MSGPGGVITTRKDWTTPATAIKVGAKGAGMLDP
jgi:hypothetical protein